MKVLHIFNSLMPSGAEMMWCVASKLLRQNNVQTYVLATAEEIGPYAGEMREAGFSVCQIPHGKHWWTYCLKLRNYIVANKFDVVQIHPEAWRFTHALAARLAGVDTITTSIHNVFLFHGKSYIKRLAVVHMLSAMKCRIIATSDSVLQNERRYLYAPILVRNWIDEDRFSCVRVGNRQEIRKEFGFDEFDKVLVTVGNCNENKNHGFLLQVLSRLPQNYKLLHVGRENESVCSERWLAHELNLESRVRFVGIRGDVPDLLSAADLYVMPSKKEGLGLACLEALYLGLHAVVADVEGLRDLASVISTCEAVPIEVDKFAERIKALIHRTITEADLLGMRKIIKSKFSLRENVQRYLDLWRNFA